jgi:hypothetical protein
VIPEDLTPEGEADFYRSLTPEQRAELLAAACRAGAALLRSRADAERAASFRDPLPESTLRALARLRAESAARRGGAARSVPG